LVLPAPIVSGDAVYAVLGDGKLHAIAVSDGAPAWPAPFAGDVPIRAQPIASDGVIYVATDDGFSFALDAKTARVLWKTPLLKKQQQEFRASSQVLSNGVLYVVGGFPLGNGTYDQQATALHGGSVQALDAATGHILWESVPSLQADRSTYLLDYIQRRPLVVGDTVFVVSRLHPRSGRNLNVLYALDKATGSLRWSFEVWGDKDILDAGASPSAPVASADMLFVASGDSTLYALSLAG
jgi:outer membrane protein assembly factor BamB